MPSWTATKCEIRVGRRTTITGLCSDDSNAFLRDVGYNMVRLPRDVLPPLSLPGKQHGAVEASAEAIEYLRCNCPDVGLAPERPV